VKTTTILWVSAAGLVALSFGAACGGSAVDHTATDGGDEGSSSGGGDGPSTGPFDATTDAGGDAGATTSDGGGGADGVAADAAPSCAPPTDATKAALCVSFTHDALSFLASDPSFDGKGLLAIDVHDTANPDAPDGGSLPALAGMIFPMTDGGAEIDLSGSLPAVRFDALPAGVAYPRAIFVDSRNTQKVGAGWWLGGYDLSSGLRTPALLQPVTLTAGAGTAVTINLTALRGLGVALTRSVAPVGNGQGPATVVLSADLAPVDGGPLFGFASAACANLGAADASAPATGFVLGAGPYYAIGVLDDFGDGGGLPPGALTSLELLDGSITSPASARLQYAASAYVVQRALDLELAVPAPDAGPDPVTCP
jgi:hypothetical protein